jgi:hypothetical protein
VERLFPTVTTRVVPLEANFGDHPAKPFRFDIGKCPGLLNGETEEEKSDEWMINNEINFFDIIP